MGPRAILAMRGLEMLDQMIPGVAKHISETKKHDGDGLAFGQDEQLALLIAHHHRAAVDQRHRGIRRQRHSALVHHGDFGRHPRYSTHGGHSAPRPPLTE